LPPGNYAVAVWHEKLGELTQPLAVAAKGELRLTFDFPPK